MKSWQKKLIWLFIAASIVFSSTEVLARRKYPRFALFQPYAYPNYVYNRRAGDLLGTLEAENKFSSFFINLEKAGIASKLTDKSENAYTVLVPSNAAFQRLSRSLKTRLANEPETLKKVLEYHIIKGTISPDKIEQGTVTSINGYKIKIQEFSNEDTGSEVIINDNTKAFDPPNVTSNGIIIEVDRVLLPPDL
jgi:uncharacterized surface protein with fasciclin (FAS1) repeats